MPKATSLGETAAKQKLDKTAPGCVSGLLVEGTGVQKSTRACLSTGSPLASPHPGQVVLGAGGPAMTSAEAVPAVAVLASVDTGESPGRGKIAGENGMGQSQHECPVEGSRAPVSGRRVKEKAGGKKCRGELGFLC